MFNDCATIDKQGRVSGTFLRVFVAQGRLELKPGSGGILSLTLRD